MSNSFYSVIQTALAVVPFVLLCIANTRLNLPKNIRNRQYYMPIIGCIYAVLFGVFALKINSSLARLMSQLPVAFSNLATKSNVPSGVSSLCNTMSNLTSSFNSGLNMELWMFFMLNSIAFLVYFAIKRICLGIFKTFCDESSYMHQEIGARYYEFSPDLELWCLKEEYKQTRAILRVFYITAAVLTSILMIISKYLYMNGTIRTIFLPTVGIIILGEIYFYLDGQTQAEYRRDILGENDSAYHNVNYSILRKYLRHIFGDKLLCENTCIDNAIFNSVTNDEIINQFEKDDDPKINSFAEFLKQLNSSGFDIDQNYVDSTIDLLNDKSILFNNPFYNDLIPYAFYPMNRNLLSNKKVLIILGRHAIENDVLSWVKRGIGVVTNIPEMWNVGILDENDNLQNEFDIGIVTRSNVSNIQLHERYSDFFENVGFILMIEPSKLITTSQIGVNLIVKKCRGEEQHNVTFCLCDKNCDGLVDALSHVLMTNITEVSATRKHSGTYSYMCWNVDGENLHHRQITGVSHYLGFGTELAFAALKNQVSTAKWYGGDMFPVTDMHWIDNQYYYDLLKYAGLPTTQDQLKNSFTATANFWSAERTDYNYFVVEDEYYNMFELLRNFATRSKKQGFVNVISSNYLLKDYMADNTEVFEVDSKAIPFISADYVRSERNTTLKLILMMSTYPVEVGVIKQELSLLGIKTDNLRKQLWYEIYKCYATTSVIKELPTGYDEAVEATFERKITLNNGFTFGADILIEATTFNIKNGHLEKTFEIKNSGFLNTCISDLKSVSYIIEDEKIDENYLGSELSDHIYQKYLPGQFFTFGGKYYEMEYLTANGQVLVRRASDHIEERQYYRQIREYSIIGTRPSEQIGAARYISNIKVTSLYADMAVKTLGYYRMNDYGDFETAKKVTYETEENGIPNRHYNNRSIVKIDLPVDGLTFKIRYTIVLLMNEIFKTLFAENSAYIVALTPIGENQVDTYPLTYLLKEVGATVDENCIYIVEDSHLDLGLLVAVERNLHRIFEYVNDYLDWHTTKLELSKNPPKEEESQITFTEGDRTQMLVGDGGSKKGSKDDTKNDTKGDSKEEQQDVPKKPGFFGKIKAKFGKKKAEPIKTEPTKDSPTEEPKDEPSAAPNIGEVTSTDTGVNASTMTLLNTDDGDDKEPSFDDLVLFPKEEYHKRYYLLYGAQEENENIDVDNTLNYLSKFSFNHNPLKQARDGVITSKIVTALYKPNKANVCYCDFCGKEIYGAEYETLSDGRTRCMSCARTAIKTEEEFKQIYEDVKRNLESFFGIKINTGIRVEMVNAQKLASRLGDSFVAQPGVNARTLGVAINNHGVYTLLLENGSPRMNSMLTIAHELTHIWQYLNWNQANVFAKYGANNRLEIYEGMAKWVEVQYAYLINEPIIAKREELRTAYRDDDYGHGFLRYMANYPFSKETYITGDTPFNHINMPLDIAYCGVLKYTPKED